MFPHRMRSLSSRANSLELFGSLHDHVTGTASVVPQGMVRIATGFPANSPHTRGVVPVVVSDA
jgi:hypothetical protein